MTDEHDFDPRCRHTYKTVVADPPWDYKTPGVLGRGDAGSRRRYGAMTHDEIASLRPPAADNAHLYLWTTNGFVEQAHDICRQWGFRPITILTWGKVKRTNPAEPSMKMGYYFRGATEHIVFGVRGSLKTRATLPTLFLWPRERRHSVKPDPFYSMVEEASPGPYLELFAREHRFGWHVWGNEVKSDVVL